MSLQSILEVVPLLCKLLRWFTRKKPTRGTVLVVEDNPLDRELMEHSLRKVGYECEVAATGEIAGRLIQSTFYPWVFIDMRLPGMSGQALMRLLQNESPNSQIVIVCAEPADLRDIPEGEPVVVIKKNVNVKGLMDLFKLIVSKK